MRRALVVALVVLASLAPSPRAAATSAERCERTTTEVGFLAGEDWPVTEVCSIELAAGWRTYRFGWSFASTGVIEIEVAASGRVYSWIRCSALATDGGCRSYTTVEQRSRHPAIYVGRIVGEHDLLLPTDAVMSFRTGMIGWLDFCLEPCIGDPVRPVGVASGCFFIDTSLFGDADVAGACGVG